MAISTSPGRAWPLCSKRSRSRRTASRVPSSAFLAIGLLAAIGLALKDRWLRAPLALVIDALVAAPALAAIALLLG